MDPLIIVAVVICHLGVGCLLGVAVHWWTVVMGCFFMDSSSSCTTWLTCYFGPPLIGSFNLQMLTWTSQLDMELIGCGSMLHVCVHVKVGACRIICQSSMMRKEQKNNLKAIIVMQHMHAWHVMGKIVCWLKRFPFQLDTTSFLHCLSMHQQSQPWLLQAIGPLSDNEPDHTQNGPTS